MTAKHRIGRSALLPPHPRSNTMTRIIPSAHRYHPPIRPYVSCRKLNLKSILHISHLRYQLLHHPLRSLEVLRNPKPTPSGPPQNHHQKFKSRMIPTPQSQLLRPNHRLYRSIHGSGGLFLSPLLLKLPLARAVVSSLPYRCGSQSGRRGL